MLTVRGQAETAEHQWAGAPDTLGRALQDAGVDRRALLGWAAGITAVLALPPVLAPLVAQAVAKAKKPTLVWLEFQNCTGDTESLLRSRSPGVADLILDLVSLDYHETLMAASGSQAEKSLTQAVEQGGHILVVEGSVPLGADGAYCVIGGRTAVQQLQDAARGATAIICVGSCSVHGGLPAASPNPTGAVPVSQVVKGVPIINLPGCPVNVDNLTATVVHYLTFAKLPETDAKGRPLFAYGQKIHDNCPRRGHFEAGNFALAYGDAGHRKGWCLYKLGCKGPWTFHNCPTQQWNGHTNWPIGVGARCIACSESKFWDLTFPGGGHPTPTGGSAGAGGAAASGAASGKAAAGGHVKSGHVKRGSVHVKRGSKDRKGVGKDDPPGPATVQQSDGGRDNATAYGGDR